jgi:hypothetical protein
VEKRNGLRPAAVFSARLYPCFLELLDQVSDGLLFTRCTGCPTFELVGREDLDDVGQATTGSTGSTATTRSFASANGISNMART